MRRFQKATEALRWPSRLLPFGSSMASGVFKRNKKLVGAVLDLGASYPSSPLESVLRKLGSKRREGKDARSVLASGTAGNCPLALDTQEHKHDPQKSVPVTAFHGHQPSQ